MRRVVSGRLKSVLLQLVNIFEHCLNKEWALTFITETFELLTKSCAKFDSLFMNI